MKNKIVGICALLSLAACTTTTPIGVTISSPTNNLVLTAATVNVTGNISGSNPVAKLVYRIDAGADQEITSQVTGSNFSFSATVPTGTSTITVRAVDTAATNASASVQVSYAGSTKPTVSIDSPMVGAKLTSNTMTVKGKATDDITVTKLEYSLNGATKVDVTSKLSAGAYAFELTNIPYGAHQLKVIATDGSSNASEATTTMMFVQPGVSGIVTQSNAGSIVEGTTVNAYATGSTTIAGTTTTNNKGFYTINLPTGAYDLSLSKEGMAGSKVIGVRVTEGQATVQHIIQKPAFFTSSLGYSTESPDVKLKQVLENGIYDASSGVIPYQINAEPMVNLKTTRIYAALGSTPGASYLTTRAFFIEQDTTGQQYLDPLAYAAFNDTTFEVVVYDSNNNRTHLIRPIKILYSFFQNNTDLLKQPILKQALAITSNKSLDYLNTGLRPQAAPAGADLYVNLLWVHAPITSYRVYRSFDGVSYAPFAQTINNGIKDASPELEIGQKVCYAVTNYLGNQESQLSNPVCTTPLPIWDVRLKTPADDSTNASIRPTLTWEHNAPANTQQQYMMALWDMAQGTNATFANRAQFTLVNANSWVWNQDGAFTGTPYETLQNGRTYEWQMIGAWAADDLITPSAISVAADVFGNYTLENPSTDFFTFTTAGN
jgi:hypothetical protein